MNIGDDDDNDNVDEENQQQSPPNNFIPMNPTQIAPVAQQQQLAPLLYEEDLIEDLEPLYEKALERAYTGTVFQLKRWLQFETLITKLKECPSTYHETVGDIYVFVANDVGFNEIIWLNDQVFQAPNAHPILGGYLIKQGLHNAMIKWLEEHCVRQSERRCTKVKLQ